jgi:4-hydroxy-tetrahydrodipicolinate synthase
MTDAIRGYWIALPSPTRSDGMLNRELFVRHTLQLFGQGIDGVVSFGTTGQGPSFSAAECPGLPPSRAGAYNHHG